MKFLACPTVLLALLCCGRVADAAPAIPEFPTGLQTLDGKTAPTLASMRGKPVIILVAPSWCRPCATDLQYLVRAQDRLLGNGLALLVVGDGAPEGKAALARSATGAKFPVVFGPGLDEWTESAGLETLPTTFVLGADGGVRWQSETGKQIAGDHPAFEAAITAVVAEGTAATRTTGGGGADAPNAGTAAVQAADEGRRRLLAAARADDALLAWPPAGRAAFLARAVTTLEKEVATLDAVVGGLPPAEVLRTSCHWRNALDRARAGLDTALRPAAEGASPLAADALERRILLYAGQPDAMRKALAPKLALAKTVTLTQKGNRQTSFTVLHAGAVLGGGTADAAAFWEAILSPEARRGWLTAHDLRNAWIFQRTGAITPQETYDSVHAERIRELSKFFEALDLYEGPPRLRAGDLLVFALPWKATNTVMQVRGFDPQTLVAEVVYLDVEQVNGNDGEYVVRTFPLSLNPPDATRRYIRPGLLWLRPAKTPTPEQAARLLRPLPWPAVLDWVSPAPAQVPLRSSNGGLLPEAVVRYLTDRAGGGFTFAGFTEEERLAFTTWTKAPDNPERVVFARGYEVLGPTQKDGKTLVSVVYDRPVIADANGSRNDPAKTSATGITYELEKTPDGWKVSAPADPPFVLLAGRSRLLLRTDDVVQAPAQAEPFYRAHGKWNELAALFEKEVRAKPDDPALLYNLACYQALKGERANAMTTLRSALSKGYKDIAHAKADPDLMSLRGVELDALLAEFTGPR